MQLSFVSGYTQAFPYFVHHTFRNEHFAAGVYLLASAGRICYCSTSFKVKVHVSHTALYGEKVF